MWQKIAQRQWYWGRLKLCCRQRFHNIKMCLQFFVLNLCQQNLIWVHHWWVIHTEPSGHSLVQQVCAENILAYCQDGIFGELVWTCVALWRHILTWISWHVRWCSSSSTWLLCIRMRPNPWKWYTWWEGLGGDVRHLVLMRIWLQNHQQRGWILLLACCVSRGL